MTDPAPEGPPPQQSKQIEINVSDDLKHGTYANFLVIGHTAHEFTLDFCQIVPSGEEGKVKADVVNRIKIAPTMVGKVIQALNTNMTNYENKFGMVREIS